MRQRELDLGVLQGQKYGSGSDRENINRLLKSADKSGNHLSPVSEPPDLKMEAGNLEEESGF